MKPARLVVLGIAVVAGGLAALLASRGREPQPPPPPAPAAQLETVDVLVAKFDLSRGQTIDARDIGWQTWPKAAANPSFIKKSDRPDAINQFIGAIVRVPIAEGEPVREPAVVFAKGSGFMAAILPHGMRAVAMEIAPVNGAGGFILPEDHVDVMLTRRDTTAQQAGGVEKYVSETILQNVRVLAVDQTVEEKNGEKVAVGKTATLEVTPDQAETLALARQQGTRSLALRSLLDSQATNDNDDTGERTSINTVRFGISTIGLDH